MILQENQQKEEGKSIASLRWWPAYPPSNSQEFAVWNGLVLWVHEAGTWWVMLGKDGKASQELGSHHTPGPCGKNKAEAMRLAVEFAIRARDSSGGAAGPEGTEPANSPVASGDAPKQTP